MFNTTSCKHAIKIKKDNPSLRLGFSHSPDWMKTQRYQAKRNMKNCLLGQWQSAWHGERQNQWIPICLEESMAWYVRSGKVWGMVLEFSIERRSLKWRENDVFTIVFDVFREYASGNSMNSNKKETVEEKSTFFHILVVIILFIHSERVSIVLFHASQCLFTPLAFSLMA